MWLPICDSPQTGVTSILSGKLGRLTRHTGPLCSLKIHWSLTAVGEKRPFFSWIAVHKLSPVLWVTYQPAHQFTTAWFGWNLSPICNCPLSLREVDIDSPRSHISTILPPLWWLSYSSIHISSQIPPGSWVQWPTCRIPALGRWGRRIVSSRLAWIINVRLYIKIKYRAKCRWQICVIPALRKSRNKTNSWPAWSR